MDEDGLLESIPSNPRCRNDRHFSDYGTLGTLWKRGDCVMRMHQSRPRDFRKGLWLGPCDRLVAWTKPIQRSLTLSKKARAQAAEVFHSHDCFDVAEKQLNFPAPEE